MAQATIEAIVRRDRLVLLLALALLTAIAWAYILLLVETMRMGGMDMRGMRMDANPFGAAMIPATKPWSPLEFGLAFIMWTVMMIGMMTPSAAPMILIYARVGRQAAARGKPLAATSYFAGGYLAAWTAFSLIATVSQWMLERTTFLTPMMQSASPLLGGLVLIAAGFYQWSPLKDICLTHCRAPLRFVQQHGGFRRDPTGSLTLGLRHGLYCIGCCWALMALLFVGGVMNVVWIAGLSVLVLAEKIVPFGQWLSRIAGVALILAGSGLLLI